MEIRVLLIALTAACAPMIPAEPAAQPSPQPIPAPPAATTQDGSFAAWREDFLARRAGPNRAAWARELADVTPNPTVIDRDRSQPEFTRGAGDYISRAVTEDRIARGRALIAANPWMAEVERQYGVPKEILVGVWAQESAFGQIQGDFDVIRSLATLAWEGRRRAWAEDQLAHALRIVTEGRRERARLTGSWAGAMGQTQFMPDNYLRLGVDCSNDGQVDIWGSDADAQIGRAHV